MAEIISPSFDEWLKMTFDHEVTDPAWYFSLDHDFWDTYEEPEKLVDYMTRTFENIDVIAQSYSDAQLNEGLHYLGSCNLSYYTYDVLDERVAWPQKERYAYSILALYQKLFLRKCTPHLLHLERHGCYPDRNPLNSTCYMWWDIVPYFGRPKDPTWKEWDSILLDVMGMTLRLDSDACREGALHGLGHWKFHYPERVQRIIDEFLAKYTDLRPELIEYAERARVGDVL